MIYGFGIGNTNMSYSRTDNIENTSNIKLILKWYIHVFDTLSSMLYL